VRELRNIIERAAILCDGGNISAANLALPGERAPQMAALTLSEVEKTHIANVLRLNDGNRTKAAQVLGIARSTLNEKIKLFSLQ
jgi:transcriptional regulator of acetoin/glycerol metabolism